jgi:hypothetical protein
VLQVEEDARRVRAGAGKLSGAHGGSGDGGATWRGDGGGCGAGAARGAEKSGAGQLGFTSICGLKVSSCLFAKQPSHVLILPPILTHFTPTDLNFLELHKYPFPFAFKF